MPTPRHGSVLALFAVTILALAACGSGGHPRAAPASASPSPSHPKPSPSPSHPKPKPKPTPAKTPLTVDQVIARLPKFGPPPPAVPVKLQVGPLATIYYRIPTNQKVAFLTIDDGLWQLPTDLTVMRAAHIPFTMFLIAPVAAKNPNFFKALRGYGGVIEDHTMTHPDLKGKPYHYQTREICYAKDSLRATFGTTPTLFRPPYGDYDKVTLKAVHDCGLRAAFYWSETVDHGKVAYQTAYHHIKPGDIILMHFRPAFAQDVLAALTAIKAAGLTPALLEDYITPAA